MKYDCLIVAVKWPQIAALLPLFVSLLPDRKYIIWLPVATLEGKNQVKLPDFRGFCVFSRKWQASMLCLKKERNN